MWLLVGFLALIPPPWDLIKKSSKFDKCGGFKKRNISFQKPNHATSSMQKINVSISETIRNYQKDLKQESRETPPFQSNSPSQDRHSTKSLPLTVFPRSQKNKMETKNTAHHDDTAVPGQVFGSELWRSWWVMLLQRWSNDLLRKLWSSCEPRKKNLLLSIESWLVNKGSLYHFIIIQKKLGSISSPISHPNNQVFFIAHV